MGEAGSVHGTDEEYIQNFGWKACRKEIAQKTKI
jgi:hypothetical protein